MSRALLILLIFLADIACAQPAPRLIVRGDDMGYAHAGNEAIVKSYTDGIMTSVEVIVPSPWFPEAVRMLADHPDLDVGVHLAITSEWDNMKWRPMTAAPGLRDADGYFRPMIYPNKNYPGGALTENEWSIEELEQEFRAQIETAMRHIPGVSHVSGHMGSTGIREDVAAMVRRICAEYGIAIFPEDMGVERASYVGPHKTFDEKIAGFTAMLEGLEAGKTYLFVDHPGLDTPELRAIHHIGYDDVAIDRQGVTDLFTDPRIRETIQRRGIQLIGYDDLK
ncbi:MAG: polysaccharide deacetylase family protein [Rhodothermales bacterium]